jgi:hypothetical protein
MEKICRNCKHWQSPHEGYWEAQEMGACAVFMNEVERTEGNNSVYGLLEGCVDVFDKRPDFEFVTGERFGCIHFKKRKKEL